MGKRRPIAPWIWAVTAWAVLAACGESNPAPTGQTLPLAPNQVVATAATIRHIDLEGGCWIIETAEGGRYEPVNLDPGFRSDGLRVWVVLRDAPDMASVCMVGPLVTLDSILTQ